MEKVPSINLFNSSSDSWRRQLYQSLTYSQSSSNQFQQHLLTNQNARSSPPIWTTCTCNPIRSNSLTSEQSLSTTKPGQYNYYNNAVKICQENLSRIKRQQPVNDVEGLKKFGFLQYAGRNPINQSKYETSEGFFNLNHELDVYRKAQLMSQVSPSNQVDIKVLPESSTQTGHKFGQERPKTQLHESKSASNLLNFQPTSPKQQKVVSFKEITNVLTSNNGLIQPQGDNAEIENESATKPETGKLDTVRSRTEKTQNLIVSAVKFSPKAELQRKIALIQSQLPQELLTFGDDLNSIQQVQKQREEVFDDLSELKNQNLDLEKDYIRRIDTIIEDFGTLKERDLMMSRSSGNLHKRKKLFVTQNQPEHKLAKN